MRYILTLLTIVLLTNVNAQGADDVFSKMAKRMDALTTISYNSYREISNSNDNYFSNNSGSCYFEFNPKADGKLARFQLQSDKFFQVYNGTEYFSLNEKDKTFESGKRKAASFANMSLLYNSMVTLRISLPVIASDPSVPKSVKDTVIDGTSYHLLKFELLKKTIEFPTGFSTFDVDVTRYYELVVDKKTLLPYIIVDRNSILKDKYYTKTIFTSINTAPPAPVASSWFFSSYTGYSLKQEAKRNPMIAVGSNLKDWVLPVYAGVGNDSLGQNNFKGKKILMEFWIKNCGYCMAAFPHMKDLQQKYGNGVEIVSLNAYETPEEIDFFYKREKPAYKMLYNAEKLANQLGIYSYPSVLIVNEAGKVIYSKSGFNKEEIEAVLENKN
ncbi:MAG: TlpA family protein disulfide reductase [Chitinophagaceae bacterium]|nr:MAG: TlpA family protein disulfide reductase [Chitinophagaceae bacterium]